MQGLLMGFKRLSISLVMIGILLSTHKTCAEEIQQRPDKMVLEKSSYKELETIFVWRQNNNFSLCSICFPREKLAYALTGVVLSVKAPEDSPGLIESGVNASESEFQSLQEKYTESKSVTQELIVTSPPELLVTIYFDFDSYKLKPSEIPKLTGLDGNIAIYGYTCDIGSEEYNLKLSWKRASAVANLLKKYGNIKISEIKGLGKCCLKESRALSRRVEIFKVSKE